MTDTVAAPGAPVSVACPQSALAPGESTTCTASVLPTQADVNSGSIRDTAVAGGSTPQGAPVASNESSATVTAASEPAISLVKSADPATVTAVGDVLTYTFIVTNEGNVTLTGVTVADVPSPPAGPVVVTCPQTTLDAGQSTSCTGSYSATQDDLDAGHIVDTATATGTPPAGDQVTSEPSSVTVTAASGPALSIVKSADPATASAAGQAITYPSLSPTPATSPWPACP